ncbi:hypothetical protein [Egbenema bharatensis]|uniref:hypothetical protein n=1 Tax=Egbenema bharatensis TaxID=3463334 RepID=UPI003A87BB81
MEIGWRSCLICNHRDAIAEPGLTLSSAGDLGVEDEPLEAIAPGRGEGMGSGGTAF